MKPDHQDQKLIPMLEELKAVPPRDPQAAQRGRARFLTEASQLRQAASLRKNQRPTIWNRMFRKDGFAMKPLMSILMIAALFASASTVFAAQNDLPNEPLYSIKVISEDASLWLTTDPALKLERLMTLAQTRLQEMTALVEEGAPVPEQVVERLKLHIEAALQIAASQSDQAMQQSLLQIQSQLQVQEQTMMQLQVSANNQPVLEQARVMTQEQLRLASQGLEDPQAFRHRYQFQNQFATQTIVPSETGVPPTSAVTATPQGQGYGPGPNPSQTPGPNATPGSGYGPGPVPTPGGSGSGSGGGSGGGNGGGNSGGGGHK